MNPIRQSVCFGNFLRNGLSAQSLIESAAQIGYASIEMLSEEHWTAVFDHGLSIACVVGHASLPDGLNKRANHDRIEAELLANIDKAAARGIGSLIAFSGNREGLSDQAGRDNCVEGLLRVKDAAEAAGVTVCMELLNSKVDHPDYLVLDLFRRAEDVTVVLGKPAHAQHSLQDAGSLVAVDGPQLT